MIKVKRMKNYNFFPWVSAIIIIAGVIMNIAQVPGANYIIIWTLIGVTYVQNSHIKKLNNRISDLES